MNLPELLQQLSADAIVEFYEVDLTVIGGTETLYFHDGTNGLTQSVSWQGIDYELWPIRAEGFDLSAKGALPRPTLQVANVYNTLTPYIEDYAGLVGAKVTRRRTFARYLDGQPTADPNQHYDDETFYVERKIKDDGIFASFELASALDLDGVRLPSRGVSVNSCAWVYREVGSDCPYVGTNYFNVNDTPVATLAEDVCSKTPKACKLRFGARAILPFGGFPAARTYKL